MHINRQQSVAAGILLIGLGVVALFNLWGLILPGALLAGGIIGYTNRRRLGRTPEAVQLGLWGVGLALVFLLNFWIGLLFLAGGSILLRGREGQVDERVQRLMGRLQNRKSAQSFPVQHVPVTTHQPSVTIVPEPQSPSTGETTRL